MSRELVAIEWYAESTWHGFVKGCYDRLSSHRVMVMRGWCVMSASYQPMYYEKVVEVDRPHRCNQDVNGQRGCVIMLMLRSSERLADGKG